MRWWLSLPLSSARVTQFDSHINVQWHRSIFGKTKIQIWRLCPSRRRRRRRQSLPPVSTSDYFFLFLFLCCSLLQPLQQNNTPALSPSLMRNDIWQLCRAMPLLLLSPFALWAIWRQQHFAAAMTVAEGCAAAGHNTLLMLIFIWAHLLICSTIEHRNSHAKVCKSVAQTETETETETGARPPPPSAP